jgi:predicted unusual protein kinase regulating ubiquinone biosynthesis (AarF/ABC1/UbiB family)
VAPRVPGMFVPFVHHNLCAETLLVTEWVDGVKLTEVLDDPTGSRRKSSSSSSIVESDGGSSSGNVHEGVASTAALSPSQQPPPPRVALASLVRLGQACFAVQLLDVGLLHGDPHPGNLLALHPGETTTTLRNCSCSRFLASRVRRRSAHLF